MFVGIKNFNSTLSLRFCNETSYYGSVLLQLSTQLRKVLKQLQEEQALNKSLLSNQQAWQDKVRKLEEDKLQIMKFQERKKLIQKYSTKTK